MPININRFQRILEDIASDIPDDLLRELNGGIVLLPEAKRHPKAKDGDLFVLGEYRVQIPGMGRYVAIFYGSFKRVFGRAMANGDVAALRAELRKTLLHELTHHLESLAGVRDLEIDDERKIADYQRGGRD
ncbi:MAG: metallopeptidase family protein [Clostridiales bacterium]|nr:metallopeptidase family protein [Clostridiales bacterium]